MDTDQDEHLTIYHNRIFILMQYILILLKSFLPRHYLYSLHVYLYEKIALLFLRLQLNALYSLVSQLFCSSPVHLWAFLS